MNQDPVTVSRIQWLRVFPILNLWQAVRMAFRLRVLIPCVIVSGLLILSGWSTPELQYCVPDICRCSPGQLLSLPIPLNILTVSIGGSETGQSTACITSPVTVIPAVLLTSVLGIAVARSTATEFCRQTRTGVIASLWFSFAKIAAGLVSLVLAVLLTVIPFAACRLAVKVSTATAELTWLANFSFCVALALGTLTAATAIVCGAAWLLSLCAIGTDSCTGSDALSRSINYVLSHKLYTTIMLATSVLLSRAAALIAFWFITAGSGILQVGSDDSVYPTSNMLSFSGTVTTIVSSAVQLGVFLSAVTVSYILLRQAEDAVHLREVDSGQSQHGT